MGNFVNCFMNIQNGIPMDDLNKDGKCNADFVLAFNAENEKEKNVENAIKRKTFEKNLEKEGLDLEYDETGSIHFVKLHAPIEVLCRYADILKIKMPMGKKCSEDLIGGNGGNTVSNFAKRICKCFSLSSEKKPHLYCEFSSKYKQLFDWEQPNFFNTCVRNLIVNFILERQCFVKAKETSDNLGIEKLLEDHVYDCAYPLHNNDDRESLLNEWANLRQWMRFQPLDKIQQYFGPKVTIYFAWLGFYTDMLIPLSVFGILCFFYGFITWPSDPID